MKRLPLILLCLILLVGAVSADIIALSPESTNQDGIMSRNPNGVYPAIRNGTGDGSDLTTADIRGFLLRSGSTSNEMSFMVRFGAIINTSSIPDDATIESAIFRAYVTSKVSDLYAPDIGLTLFSPASNATIATADYNTWGSTRIANDITYANIATGQYNNWTITNLDAIDKTGYTRIMMRDQKDIDFVTPAWSSVKDASVNVYDTSHGSLQVILEVNYTPTPASDPPVADTTPPSSITNLANTTTCQNITWNWDNPADADFNHTMIYQNGTFLHNVTNATTSDLWEGLAENLEYTFSSHTCDITGNCNTTWVNQTAQTGFCGIAPVAAFTSNKTSGTAPLYVGFTDTSTNTPTVWAWSFNNVTGNNTVVWWSTVQNPTITLGAGNWTFALNASNAYGFDDTSGDYWINVSVALPPAPLLVCENQTGNITINLEQVSQTAMKWNWNITEAITALSVDTVYRYFDTAVPNFTANGFLPSSYHIIRVSNATDYGELNCTTNATPPAPWTPEINPSTEFDARADNLLGFWWIPALILGLFVLFKRF